jgi:pimeloyl-ACP methyl ester carboxylesterase
MRKHNKFLRITITVFIILTLVVVIGPFLVPIPPLNATAQPEDLADEDSLFVEVNQVRLHYKLAGDGEPVFILMHGFGASLFSWREVLVPLAEYGTVLAYDRIGFGLSERPVEGDWEGANPYTLETQTDQLIGLMDHIGATKAILVGNSAGGSVATYAALRYPDRIQAIILVDPAILTGGPPGFIQPLLRTPQLKKLGPLIARSLGGRSEDLLNLAWNDPSKVTLDILEGYREPLQIRNWDKALWELTMATRWPDYESMVDKINIPVLVITGANDKIVPPEDSIQLAELIPNSDLVVIPNCGHLPQEECPADFLKAVTDFINGQLY